LAKEKAMAVHYWSLFDYDVRECFVELTQFEVSPDPDLEQLRAWLVPHGNVDNTGRTRPKSKNSRSARVSWRISFPGH